MTMVEFRYVAHADHSRRGRKGYGLLPDGASTHEVATPPSARAPRRCAAVLPCNLEATAAEPLGVEEAMNDMERDMTKRTFLSGAAVAAGALLTGCARGAADRSAETFEVAKSPAEWRAILPPERYAVLREEKTEKPRSSPLDAEKRSGVYACAGCALPVYASTTKFESGTGWPSFTAPIPGAVRTRSDGILVLERTEVHCRRCGGHLGHVFDDGPPPTGKRFCMNGAAMTFSVA